ncbi:RNA polymerase sigma-70 factor [Microbacterium sp. gxy059]|uniref:RNA polymerase sigma-70 factor n=1 Tax=Microbacterium sp. gxy059 TaxID=2957199 RepID=UPI003D95D61F
MSDADVIRAHRGLLFGIAYEILGSAADAEDVLQESWIRWHESDREGVRDERAYLARIVARQALNRLRPVRRRREDYAGPWLPEPLLTAPDVADDVVLAESVSTAMMLVLETLGPVERAVFVLREVFDFGYDEIARAVDRRPDAVRQIASRARAHVAARRPRAEVSAAEVERVVERFRIAAETGDVQGLVDVLAPDVVMLSDGGGRVTAARKPVVGVERVLHFLGGLLRPYPGAVFETEHVNGAPGIWVRIGGSVDGVVSFAFAGAVVDRVFYVRNPEKLGALGDPVSLTR